MFFIEVNCLGEGTSEFYCNSVANDSLLLLARLLASPIRA